MVENNRECIFNKQLSQKKKEKKNISTSRVTQNETRNIRGTILDASNRFFPQFNELIACVERSTEGERGCDVYRVINAVIKP